MIDRNDFAAAWLGLAVTGALDTRDPFLRFMAAWMAFNAVYDDGTARGSEWKRIETFVIDKDLEQIHRSLLQHEGYAGAVNVLAATGVGDDRTGARRQIQDQTNVLEVMRCVYQVRCNLFHGGKHPTDPRDRELSYASYVIVASLLSWRSTGRLPHEAATLPTGAV